MNKAVFKMYEAYKESGIEWLGDVPAHWLEQRVKDIAVLERGKFTHRPRNDPQMYDGKHPFIQTGDVARANKYVKNYKQTLSDKGTEVSKKFKKGTLLMAIAANIGDVAILGFDSYLPDSLIAYTPKKTDTNYLFYLFTATKNELNRVKITSTQDNLNLERLNSLVKFLPPLSEQLLIASHLDTKTAQIDRQIDLLSQKSTQYGKLKQSLINETVTHGLNKSVPMKDSGVDWIGEVPEHWKFTRVKGYITFQKGKTPTSYTDNSEFLPYLSMDFLRDKNKAVNYVLPEDMLVIVSDEDLLLLWDGANAGEIMMGKKGYLSSTMAVVKSDKSFFDKRYLYFFLKAMEARFKDFSNGTTIPHFSPNVLLNNSFGIPPLSEQVEICMYLNEKTKKIESIVTIIFSQIDKLKELRRALINDVVTGKIKVSREE